MLNITLVNILWLTNKHKELQEETPPSRQTPHPPGTHTVNVISWVGLAVLGPSQDPFLHSEA